MNLFLEVVDDLASFAVDAIRGFFLGSPKIESPERVLRARPEYTVLPASTQTGGPREIKVYSPLLSAPQTKKDLQKSTVMYTSSLATPLRSEPGVMGDTVITVLPYGSMVMVLETRDLWAYVASGEYTGWVYIDDLEDRAAHVYPELKKGEVHDESDPATVRLRALIGDEFGAGESALPLQPEEYVLYRLFRKGVRVAWPQVRPRTPGKWAEILSPVLNVVISPSPSVGAVLEFLLPSEAEGGARGHLVYVEAVFPDQSLQLSEVGWKEEGVFSEHILAREEWQKLQPVFLVFQ